MGGRAGEELEQPTGTEDSHCARKYAEGCTYMSPGPHNPMRWFMVISPFHTLGDRGTRRAHRTCPVSHSLELTEVAFEPKESASRSHVCGIRLNWCIIYREQRPPENILGKNAGRGLARAPEA